MVSRAPYGINELAKWFVREHVKGMWTWQTDQDFVTFGSFPLYVFTDEPLSESEYEDDESISILPPGGDDITILQKVTKEEIRIYLHMQSDIPVFAMLKSRSARFDEAAWETFIYILLGHYAMSVKLFDNENMAFVLTNEERYILAMQAAFWPGHHASDQPPEKNLFSLLMEMFKEMPNSCLITDKPWNEMMYRDVIDQMKKGDVDDRALFGIWDVGYSLGHFSFQSGSTLNNDSSTWGIITSKDEMGVRAYVPHDGYMYKTVAKTHALIEAQIRHVYLKNKEWNEVVDKPSYNVLSFYTSDAPFRNRKYHLVIGRLSETRYKDDKAMWQVALRSSPEKEFEADRPDWDENWKSYFMYLQSVQRPEIL